MLLDTDKLASLNRGGFEEIILRGELSVVDDNGIVFANRQERGLYPVRSTLKPFQFLAAEIPLAEWEGQERYAACMGSVLATEFQCSKMREWSQPRKELVPHLKLPRSFPTDETHRVHLKVQGENQAQLFHTCFSKHMGILEGCKRKGWPLEGYLETSHPYQQHLLSMLSQLVGRAITAADCVVDGCLLPTPSLTTLELAKLYQMLAAGDDDRLCKVRDLMMKFPAWIGGPSSIDTEFMLANQGKAIAKIGADGLMAIGVLPTKERPTAVGIVVKLELGFQPQRTMQALEPALRHYNLDIAHSPPRGQKLVFHYDLKKKPSLEVKDITPLLRAKIGLFPEEVAFRRDVSHATDKGDVITLSSIQTTLHAGAHTDAPNHFAKSSAAIHEVTVEKYFGPCQVIRVQPDANGLITFDSLKAIALRATRVLFRTDSYPDETHFTDKFAALSEEVIHWLGENKVCLVGIDTPSVDPAKSNTLSAHLATLRWEMAILENVRLSAVEEGLYTLMAVPLRIEGGDASPVRALLVREN